MAMNKKQQAEMERLREELRVAKASQSLERTSPVEPDVMPPESCSKADARNGWTFNSHNASVNESCTTSTSHSTWGFASDRTSWSQMPIRLYSTKLLALKALRYALEQKYAKSLADIDRQIEEDVG